MSAVNDRLVKSLDRHFEIFDDLSVDKYKEFKRIAKITPVAAAPVYKWTVIVTTSAGARSSQFAKESEMEKYLKQLHKVRRESIDKALGRLGKNDTHDLKRLEAINKTFGEMTIEIKKLC